MYSLAFSTEVGISCPFARFDAMVDEGTDHSDWTITVIPEVASLDRVHAARETADRARALQEEAATAWREAALALRAEGLSVADAATIMGVSRGRISQLTA